MQRVVAVMLALVLVGTSACTSLKAVPLSVGGASVPAVEVGDRVVVTKKSGEKQEFEVTAVESDALVGDTRIAYEDIAMLKVKSVDKGKTAGAVVLAIGAVLIFAAVQVLDAFSGFQ